VPRLLIAQEEKFTLFINGDSQERYFDYSKQGMDGAFAFNGSQDSGKGSCEFEKFLGVDPRIAENPATEETDKYLSVSFILS
jgi:hypothetical protein